MIRLNRKTRLRGLASLLCATSAALWLPGTALIGQAQTSGRQTIWFDTPNPTVTTPVWGTGEVAPTGSGQADRAWEHTSLPVGNGSIGANVFGSIAAERLTFNEKTLWRGGPNTRKGADYYWNVNKESAHVLADIRQAFLDGDADRAAQLTQDNFNGVVSYEADGEEPFRFGSFTSAGQFSIATGLDESAATHYVRELSLDSALVNVRFTLGGVRYCRTVFVSYPDQVMVVRFTTDGGQPQDLTLCYAPNPLATGRFRTGPKGELSYTATLDNNGMRHTVRVRAIAPGGKVKANKQGRLSVSGASDIMFLITADTDYKINFDPDFSDPKAYVGTDPERTTREWMDAAARRSPRGRHRQPRPPKQTDHKHMAVHKKYPALGRGLDALISTEEEVHTSGSSSINEIPVDKIRANPAQPRRDFDPETLRELADSIRELGIVQPITLRQMDDGTYQIIAGERRWRASSLAGLATIPAYIRTADDEKMMQMALVENIQREDLNAIEIALAYQSLIERYNLTQDQLSEKVGKNRATIANCLRLLKLPAPVQMALQNREIDQGHARALLGLDHPTLQIKLFNEIREKGYSVRQVEEMVKALNNGETVQSGRHKLKGKKAARLPEEYDMLRTRLSDFFKTKVQMTCSPQGKGKISIPFASEEELERIIGLFDKMKG